MNNNNKMEQLYNFVTGDEDARVCKDIPDSACHHQPKNFFAYLAANVFNKIADELTSAKLVLPWLMGFLGAPAALSSLLVPIREAGVLLPQMVVAAAVRHLPIRKGIWLLGGVLSAVSLAGMALVTMILDGVMAGWAIVGLLVVFSLARGLCSVSAKDVLGKTVSKSRRGILMGWSAGLGGVGVLLIGLWLSTVDASQADMNLFIGLFGVSVVCWMLAIIAFAVIVEHPGATEGGGNALQVALSHLALLKTDKPFRELIISRGLLLAVELVPPYYVLLAHQMTGGDVANLGWLIIATGLGASVSSPLWGRWGDVCSRCVMVWSAVGCGVLGLLTALAVYQQSAMASSVVFWAAIIFMLTILLSGEKLGRKIYLVDLGTGNNRAAYVAVSNTVMGVLMVLAGVAMGWLNVWLPTLALLVIFALASMLAAAVTVRMKNVSEQGD